MEMIVVILLAILLDLALGDPKWLPHPVRWMGFLINYLDQALRIKIRSAERGARSTERGARSTEHGKLRVAGVVLWFLVVGGTALVSTVLMLLATWINVYLGVALNIIMIFYALAIRSLTDEGRVIRNLLKKGDLESARKRLQTIVSRDCSREDEQGVMRGVIETITENLSDGVIAPLLFAMIAGGPLALTYKAVNTLDSMVGYKNENYIDFGWFSARADDVVNWIPARITGLFIVAVALITLQNPLKAIKAWRRDAQKGPSPNGGIPIVTFAGARDVALGGDCYAQDGSRVCIPKVGGSRCELSFDDIRWANGFVYLTTTIFFIVFVTISLFAV